MGMLYEHESDDSPIQSDEQVWIDTYIASVPAPHTAELDTTPNGLGKCIIMTNGKSGDALSRSAILITGNLLDEDPVKCAHRHLYIIKQFDSMTREEFDRWIRGPRINN